MIGSICLLIRKDPVLIQAGGGLSGLKLHPRARSSTHLPVRMRRARCARLALASPHIPVPLICATALVRVAIGTCAPSPAARLAPPVMRALVLTDRIQQCVAGTATSVEERRRRRYSYQWQASVWRDCVRLRGRRALMLCVCIVRVRM